jgi:hypothetical protein
MPVIGGRRLLALNSTNRGRAQREARGGRCWGAGEHGEYREADRPLQSHHSSIRPHARVFYSVARRSRSALAMTDTELKAIAAAAKIGLSRTPNTGYRTPAAIGTPAAL